MNAKVYKKLLESYSTEELDYEPEATIMDLQFADNELKRNLILKKKIIEEVMSFDIPENNLIFIDNQNLNIFEEKETDNLSLEQTLLIFKNIEQKEKFNL